MATLTDFESDARDLINMAKDVRVNPKQDMILGVFKAMYSCALPCWQIEKIAFAMYGGHNEPDLKAELTRLVRAGFLRSRVVGNERLYELNVK